MTSLRSVSEKSPGRRRGGTSFFGNLSQRGLLQEEAPTTALASLPWGSAALRSGAQPTPASPVRGPKALFPRPQSPLRRRARSSWKPV